MKIVVTSRFEKDVEKELDKCLQNKLAGIHRTTSGSKKLDRDFRCKKDERIQNCLSNKNG